MRFFALFGFVASVGMATAAAAAADPGAPALGLVTIYGQQHLHRRLDASETVRLPRRAGNRARYGVVLMAIAASNEAHAPFVEIGLERRPEDRFALRVFVSTNLPGEPERTDDDEGMPTLADDGAPHRLRVTADASTIALSLDGSEISRLARERFFPMHAYGRLYVQMSGEVSAYGDVVSGSISDIAIQGDRGREPGATICGREDTGLRMTTDRRGTYGAAGVFTPGGAWSWLLLPSLTPVARCPNPLRLT